MGTLESATGVASPASLSYKPSARATFSGRHTIMVFLGVALTSYRALVQRRPTPPLLPRKTIFGRNGYKVVTLQTKIRVATSKRLKLLYNLATYIFYNNS